MTKQLHIIHVMRAPVGGLFRHVLDLAGYQASLGHDVGIIADATVRDALTEEKFSAIRPKLALGIKRIAMSRLPGLGDISALRAVANHAAHLNPDVLHGHGAKGGAYARLAAKRLRKQGQDVKSFYTPHGGSLHYAPESVAGRVIGYAERMLGKFTDGLIFESAYASKLYRDRFGLVATPHRVVPNGLHSIDFETPAPAADAAEFLYVGELRMLKGVDVLLDALAILDREKPVTAVIVGAGPDSEALQTRAKELGLAGRVQFPGVMPARRAFALGKAIVVPSRAESFPYIVLEAAAAGLPVIATNVGGIPEMVEGTSAELVPPGNINALADRLRLARSGCAKFASSADQLRSRVAERFTIAAMGDAITDFYGSSRA